jgi:hypothetical protein
MLIHKDPEKGALHNEEAARWQRGDEGGRTDMN